LGSQNVALGGAGVISNALHVMDGDLFCNYFAIGGSFSTARVQNARFQFKGGLSISGAGNVLVLDKAVSTDNVGTVFIGNGSGANTVVMSGGTVFSNAVNDANSKIIIGGGVEAFNGLVVRDADVYTYSALTVGGGGKSNTLVVADGGTVHCDSDNLNIGSNAGGDYNTVTVDGKGSEIRAGGSFSVGGLGSFNTLIASNGARLAPAGYFILGWSAGSSNNTVLATGADTDIGLGNRDVRIGNTGTHNRLILDEGATMGDASPFTLCLGTYGGADFNSVTVMGGAVLSNVNLVVGGDLANHGNSLVVSNATVEAIAIHLGPSVTLEARGTNPVIKVGGGIAANHGATFRYGFDPVAPTPGEPLVESTGGTLGIAGPVTLEIDAERLGKAGGGKGIVLMRFASAPGDTAWGNFTNAPPVMLSGEAKVYVGNGGRDLLCDVAGSNGTVILVR